MSCELTAITDYSIGSMQYVEFCRYSHKCTFMAALLHLFAIKIYLVTLLDYCNLHSSFSAMPNINAVSTSHFTADLFILYNSTYLQ